MKADSYFLTLCLLLCCATPQLLVGVGADYQFELQLHRYQNPTHRLSIGRCCDSLEFSALCSDHCDTALDFCLSAPGESNCSMGQRYTGPLYPSTGQETDDIEFPHGVEIAFGVPNPVVFTGERWPGGFELLVSVLDDDGNGEHEDVDRSTVSRSNLMPSNDFSMEREVRGQSGYGFLRLNYRVMCTSNYTGSDCTTLCLNGQCFQDLCILTHPCLNGGTCFPVARDSGYVCSCPEEFTGTSCEHAVGPALPDPTPRQNNTTQLSTITETEETTPDSEEDIPMATILGTSIAVLVALVTLSLLTLALVWLRVRTRHMKGGNKAIYSVPTSHNEAYGVIFGKQEAVAQHGVAGSSGAEPNTPQTTSNVASSHGYLMKLNEAYECPSAPVTNDNHNMATSQSEAYAPLMTSSEDCALHNLSTVHNGATQGQKELQNATADDDGPKTVS